MLAWAVRNGRRVLVFLVGVLLCLAGAVMLVLPGPGLLVLFAGLAVLSLEFAWARGFLHRLRAEVDRRTGRRPPEAPPPQSPLPQP